MHSGYEHDTIVAGRTIDSHIRRIRGKLAVAGGDPIETVHGLGYRIRSDHG
jgi:two-component system OmpR family response regulator